MIVKYFTNKGNGSIKASFDYLLGAKRDRPEAKILCGNPELTQSLVESLPFKNSYTVGVLSFEESDLEHHKKIEIIDRFEKVTFAGLDKNQYNIDWIEHRDKGRLELNFVIANVELSTGKRYQPYYDKIDRKHINNFKNMINYEFDLSDPNDPRKKQATNSLTAKNVSKSHLETKKQIDNHIVALIQKNVLKCQNDVINTLKEAGFTISRVTNKSISIQNPDPSSKNIRLKGAIYENRRFDQDFREQYTKDVRDYTAERTSDYKQALKELEQSIDRKREFNSKTYKQDSKIYSNTINSINDNIINRSLSNSLHNQRQDQATRLDNNQIRTVKKLNTTTTATELNTTERQQTEIIDNEKSLISRCRKINNRVRSGESKINSINATLDERKQPRTATTTKIDKFNEHIRERKQETKRAEQYANETITRLEQRFNAFGSAIKRVREAIDKVTRTIKRSFGWGL